MKKKYYALYRGGADFEISTEPDYSGSYNECSNFSKAKKLVLFKIRNDISELKSALFEIKSLKKRDVK